MQDLPATLSHIDATWRAFVPEYPINRHFLSRDFDALYANVSRQATLVTVFSVLAIVIACVGLFGLSSLTTEQRTKEIGVRKALGGSVTDIVRLFCREFGVLVLLANVVAWPVAYVLVRRWLDHFVYRIDVSPVVFVVSALFTLALALVTVGVVAARAANADPVHALRHE
jgi:putative ABC transport system permease protein